MESLGKEIDLSGNTVNQGISVFGNKGSTDQHAYIQQLRDGINNFFVIFLEVLKEREGPSIEVDPGVTSGDYLSGFFLGTRSALFEKNRESVTLTVADVSAFTVGVLIALFERAVGLYAALIHINAYHQPGVEAGKRAASSVIALQLKIQEMLRGSSVPMNIRQIADGIGAPDDIETVFKICERLAANPGRGVQKIPAGTPFEAAYRKT
jgi:glucose-6-phosphate isomerase